MLTNRMKKRVNRMKKMGSKIKKKERRIKQGPLFIANIISVILLAYVLFTDPSITGFTVAKTALDLTNPPDFAVLFIITTFALDVYFYMKSRRKS